MRQAREAHRTRDQQALARERAERREREANDVRRARDEYRAAEASKVAARRGEWTRDQEASLARRREAVAEASTRELRRRLQAPGAESDRLVRCGTQAANWHGYGIGLGLGLGFSWCSPYGWYWNSYWNNCWSASNWWWGGWNNVSNWGWGWGIGGYPYSWWCHPLSMSYRCWWGGWPNWNTGWWPGAYVRYWSASPVYYSSILVESTPAPADPVVIYVDGASTTQVAAGGVAPSAAGPGEVGEAVQYGSSAAAAPMSGGAELAKVLERGPDTLARAANQHLALGDVAFRERRYADAVHYYAKAIEFRPGDGVMYLVLADALLATGDYHYGAFALRRALELDPTLADSAIDKHEFYSDAKEFDSQLQLLERFLADHSGDADARLLLAANYLFGRKPALAIDLLEAGASAAVRGEGAGKLVLEAAKRARGQL